MPLLAVWVGFVNYIDASAASYNFVSLSGICLNRSSNFHGFLRKIVKVGLLIRESLNFFKRDFFPCQILPVWGTLQGIF